MFDLIYADPPWSFKTYSDKGKGKSPDNHYPVLDIEEIKKLNIGSIVNKDSVLLLWATPSMLMYAIDTISAWGFTYKTIAFTWIKTNKKNTDSLFWGCGYYTRQNTEICLLATRGNVLPRESHSVHQVVISPVEAHSKKPDEVMKRIEQLFGDIKRVELFARRETPGWVCVGNEITGRDIRDDLKLLALDK